MADLKGQHNLGRAQFRGGWNMEIQAYLSAAAHDLKKLARESRKVMAGASALAPDFSEMGFDLLSRTCSFCQLAYCFR